MSKTALILITDGTEDIELAVTSDVLRRANVNVTIASLEDQNTVTLARQLKVQPDKKLSDVLNNIFDAVILPGGPGHTEYVNNKNVGDILKRHEANGKILAAICAGPIVLKAHGIAPGVEVTSYPKVANDLKSANYKYSEESVVVSSSADTGHGSASIVTSRGPGTTFEFVLKIVELLAGDEVASTVRKVLLL